MTKRKLRKPIIERREAQRVQLPLVVSYRPKGKKKWIKTSCINISGKGIRLPLEQSLEPGSIVEIKIRVREPASEFFIGLGMVKWCKEIVSNKFEVGLRIRSALQFEMGIQFQKIKTLDEFIEFICDKMVDTSLIDEKCPQMRRKR